MGNKKYFCIVKKFHAQLLLWFLTLSFSLPASAQATRPDSALLQSMDQVDISLLTCGPGQEVYSYYGHSAVRFHDKGRGQDLVVNYGLFSFRQKFFILRFVFGLCYYQMGLQTMQDFIAEYQGEGRWVKEQVINLTNEEKWAIAQAIDSNYRPEARTYLYNFFYDNCTTRARDLILNHLQYSHSIGKEYSDSIENIHTSYREMVHQWCGGHPWAQFGVDLLLGVKADRKTDRLQQEFLPDTLRKDFDNLYTVNADSTPRKLVAMSHYLLKGQTVEEASGFSLTPMVCAIGLLILTIVICLLEWRFKRIAWPYDAVLLTLDGLAGLILFAMIFSKHPTVSLNFQILMLCPLSIVFVVPVVRALRRGKAHAYLKWLTGFIVVGLALYVLQKYNPAMIVVALCLLVRLCHLQLITRKLHKKPEE